MAVVLVGRMEVTGTELQRVPTGKAGGPAHGLRSGDEGHWLWRNRPQLDTGFPCPPSSVALTKRLTPLVFNFLINRMRLIICG